MTTATVKTRNGTSAVSLVHCGMFAALMMIGANITAFAPFLVVGGVPITLQTFFAILAGLLLGSRLGAMAMTVYMFIGLAGAPVFAKFSGGFGQILSPTFGFVVSFILAAYLTGKIVEKNGKLHGYIIAALVGMIVNYIIGTNLMYIRLQIMGCGSGCLYIQSGMALDDAAASERHFAFGACWDVRTPHV